MRAEDHNMKLYTNQKLVREDLEKELNHFLSFQRNKLIKDKAQNIRETLPGSRTQTGEAIPDQPKSG